MLEFLKAKLRIILAILFVTGITLGNELRPAWPDGKLHAYFLNIGQGDAALLRTPSQKLILIDGGPGQKVLHELGDILPFWRRSLDLVIMSHPDKDHIEGLAAVIDRYEIKRFLMTGAFQNNALVQNIFQKLHEKNVPVILAESKRDFIFDDGTVIDILFPFETTIGETEFTNSTSVVLKVKFKNQSLLFTGDADEFVERKLLEAGENLGAEVLKVGHHGSKYSSSFPFLQAVEPKKAVLSVGRNRYGHPHPEVIERLQKIGAEIFRTDRQGRIEFSF